MFARFQAWQYLTPDAAVRGLLSEIVGAVQKHVDWSGLGSLPDAYLDVLGECPSWWLRASAILLRHDRSPESIIGRLQDVLLRTRIRVVVFVDDFDRLEGKSHETQDAIAAALNQLQNLTCVQYVLCVGPMKNGGSSDLLKLTRFQELVPGIRGEDVASSLRKLREEAVRNAEGHYLVWMLPDNENTDPLDYNYVNEYFGTGLAARYTQLLQSPRRLKAAEREVREKWNGGLKGEICWYDLLCICCLRIGEPRVYEWIMRQPSRFMGKALTLQEREAGDRAEKRENFRRDLGTLLDEQAEQRLLLVEEILHELFPTLAEDHVGNDPASLARYMTTDTPSAWEQHISSESAYGDSYFKRYCNGFVAPEMRDQPLLQYMRDLQENGVLRAEFQRRCLSDATGLARELPAFAHLSGLLQEPHAIEVCNTPGFLDQWIR